MFLRTKQQQFLEHQCFELWEGEVSKRRQGGWFDGARRLSTRRASFFQERKSLSHGDACSVDLSRDLLDFPPPFPVLHPWVIHCLKKNN